MDYKDLNLIGASSPHIRTRAGTGHIMGEVLIALIPALCFAVYNFGPRALVTTLVSMAGCCFFEWLYRTLMGKNNTVDDLSAAVTGALIAFVCPVTIPYWILLIGDFFAIVVVKQLFGGVGKNFLNPALAARAFMLSWAGEMTRWVGPRTAVTVTGTIDAVTYPTPMALLHENNLEGLMQMYDLPDMLVGFIGGSIGEVSALLLMLGRPVLRLPGLRLRLRLGFGGRLGFLGLGGGLGGHGEDLLQGRDLIVEGHVIEDHIQFFLLQDLGIGLGLFKIKRHDLCDDLGCHAKIRRHFFQSVLN